MINFGKMSISWSNTESVLQDFAKILVCGKCALKAESPIRFTNCGHFFCYNCAKLSTKCFKCDVPVQPNEMSHDHIISNLISNCGIIAEVINKRNLWNNNKDTHDISMNTTVSKIICTPKNISIPKRNINKSNCKGETRLHIACLKQNVEHVKLLLMAGADPNTKDHAGWTPLQETVSYGYTELCQLLLAGGALPDIPGDENRRPLHDAAISNRIEEAKLLLQYHADKDVYDQCGKSPLDYCKSDEMREILMGNHSPSYFSEKTSDLNQTLDKSFVTGQEKLVVLALNLKPENQKTLNFIAAQHKFKVLTTDRPSVTHVIVEVNDQNIIKLTVDVLFAIIRGSWLLSSEWIALARDMEDISKVDLFELFEVSDAPLHGVPKKARLNTERRNPRLFNNCFFYFTLQANSEYRIGDIYLTKNDLTKLIKEGEGTMLSREPDPKDLEDNASRAIPFHTADNPSHPLHRCTHYIIYVPGKGEPRIKYKMPHIKSLPLMWLIECIEKFTLVDPGYLGLS